VEAATQVKPHDTTYFALALDKVHGVAYAEVIDKGAEVATRALVDGVAKVCSICTDYYSFAAPPLKIAAVSRYHLDVYADRAASGAKT